jgi:hypothetical protein
VLPAAVEGQTGQSVVGTVSDARSGEPLPTALVALIGDAELPVRQVVAGPDGRFDLPVPGPGTWQVQVSRLGYGVHVEDRVRVAAGERVTLDIRMGAAPIHLEALAVEVAAGTRCRRIDPDEASLLVQLWDQASNSLRVVAWASRDERYAFQQVTWEREVDLLSENVAERRGQGRFTGSPFLSVPIDSLSEHGWVRPDPRSNAVVWHVPDSEALLSSRFREEHCFTLRPHAERPDWVGVAFEPVRRDGPPGIEGVVWMDRVSAELRRLDFTYTDHPLINQPIPAPLLELFGGEVEFRTLPDGVVVVEGWSVRMPAYLRRVRDGVRAPEITAEPAAHFRRVRNQLPRSWLDVVQEEVGFGFREEGGELLRIVTPTGAILPGRGVAAVEGIVRDSTAGAFPLARAELEILGTGVTRRTGLDGRFRAEVPEGGEFEIRVRHPRLDSLGIGEFTHPVTLFPGQSRTVELAVPSLRTLLVLECGSDPEGTDRAILHGRVLDTSGSGVVEGSRVRLRPGPHEVRTDALGRFLLCDVPAWDGYELRAEWAGVEGDPSALALRPGDVRGVELRLGVGARGIVHGRVLDGVLGTPVAAARVAFEGPEPRSALTDGDGGFRIEGIAAGPYRLRVEHISYRDPDLEVELEGAGRVNRVEVRLLHDAVALDPLEVQVESRPAYGPLAAVYDRVDRTRALGLGRIWDRNDLDGLVSASMVNLLADVPGVERTADGTWVVAAAQALGLCEMVLYVNGTIVPGMSPDELSVRDLEVVEIYRRASEVPAEFAGSRARCGVISVWTRRGY